MKILLRLVNEYPMIKWVFIILAVLYVLDKYLKIDPIGKLLDLIGGDDGEVAVDLNDLQLKKLVQLFNQQNYEEVAEMFGRFSPSYRSYGFKVLGEFGQIDVSDRWISQEINSALPQIIKGAQLINKAWKIRGNKTIDKVSQSSLESFKDHLRQAESILLDAKRQESDYQVNANSLLLKLYKALDVNRDTIHSTFEESVREHPSHAGLHYNYFTAISYKWGGTKEEIDQYYQTSTPVFIQLLTLSLLYLDLTAMYGQKDKDKTIKTFLEEAKNVTIQTEELYQADFYRNAYFVAHNLGYKDLKKHYANMAKPYLTQQD